jgi:ATP/maltotriose-dependent transcriptional regulator MalT
VTVIAPAGYGKTTFLASGKALALAAGGDEIVASLEG